jgi:hypothetical protein
MKLLEKFAYSFVLFLFLYVILALGLRMFEVTSSSNAHMIGGITGLVLGMLLFLFLLIKKK